MKRVVVYPRMDYHLGAIDGAKVGDHYSLQPYNDSYIIQFDQIASPAIPEVMKEEPNQ